MVRTPARAGGLALLRYHSLLLRARDSPSCTAPLSVAQRLPLLCGAPRRQRAEGRRALPSARRAWPVETGATFGGAHLQHAPSRWPTADCPCRLAAPPHTAGDRCSVGVDDRAAGHRDCRRSCAGLLRRRTLGPFLLPPPRDAPRHLLCRIALGRDSGVRAPRFAPRRRPRSPSLLGRRGGEARSLSRRALGGAGRAPPHAAEHPADQGRVARVVGRAPLAAIGARPPRGVANVLRTPAARARVARAASGLGGRLLRAGGG
mmetsp:Transcript_47978/g.155893  ORF Transcript_47978/g.155893 Transcript_47978/m.155893 type:complete len:261 (-) Transcript_47978:162-944(-)